jgi:hypothetical protein
MVGAPYYVDGATVRDQFLVRLVNKRAEPTDLTVTVHGLPAGATAQGIAAPVTVGPLAEEIRFLIVEEARDLYTAPFSLTVDVTDPRRSFTLSRSMEFLGPEPLPAVPASGARGPQ